MDEKSVKSRKETIKNELFDAGANELTEAGKEIIHTVFQDVKEWVREKYNSFKSSSVIDTETELEELEMRITLSNEAVNIGMEKKEIAVMWAMRKLGYSQEETQKVLDKANEAYKHKD